MKSESAGADVLRRRRALAILCLGSMALTAAAGRGLAPTRLLADELGPLQLASSLPMAFGNWVEDGTVINSIVNPQQAELLNHLYSELLTRTYINNDGYKIMLSVAYGGNQSDAFQVHYPEVCYPAQGFEIISRNKGVILTPHGSIAVVRLATRRSAARPEPVTYWVMVGESQADSSLMKKMVEFKYSVKGLIADGLLFRLSSIDSLEDVAYARHDSFAAAMMAHIQPRLRARIAGLTG